MNFFDYFFLNKRKKEKAELTAAAALFLNAVQNEKFNQATEILNQSDKIIEYLKQSEQQPLTDLALKLSQAEAKKEAETLFRALCKKGYEPSTQDVSLLALQERNFPLLIDLYDAYPSLRPRIEKQNPLHKLSLTLAQPAENPEAARLFVQLHKQGIKADKATAMLLFSQPANLPVLRYLFIAQNELDPQTNLVSDKMYVQNCIQSAFQNKNTEGLRLLYTQGAPLIESQLKAMNIQPNETENQLRTRALYRQKER